MPRFTVLDSETQGIDLKVNPLSLGNKRLRLTTNMVFDEGRLKTRPGFRYHQTGISGQFQGATEFRPAQGISYRSFADNTNKVAIAAGGNVYLWDVDKCCTTPIIDTGTFLCKGAVNLYQAENYLIIQNVNTSTFWFDGFNVTESLGMQEQDWNDPDVPRVEVKLDKPIADAPVCYVDPNVIPVTISFINSITK